MHSFTSEDLLQYLYSETSTEKTKAIKTALENDWSLKEKFDLLSLTHDDLNTLNYTPSSLSINNILNYAEKTVEELTSHA